MPYASRWRALPNIISIVAIVDQIAGAIEKAAGKSENRAANTNFGKMRCIT
jgi:hypothetical protein